MLSNPRHDRSGCINALLLLAFAAAALVPATARADGCTDYGTHIRWLDGENFGWYAPGYGSEAFAYDVATAGNRLFLAHETGLVAYDASDPSHPVGLGGISEYAQRLDASGDYVYALAYGRLDVIHAAFPSQMYVEGSIGLSDARDLAALPPYVYVADGSTGIKVVSVAGPPAVVGHLGNFGTATRIAAANGRAYVVASTGLWVINATVPSQPYIASHLFGAGTMKDVAVGADGYLYVTDSGIGLRIFNLSDPDFPAQTGTVALPAADQLAAFDRHAAVGGGGSVTWVDATNPSSPQATGAFKGVDILGARMRAGILFAAAGWDGLQVLDFSSPIDAPEAAFLADGAAGRDLVAAGNRLSLITPDEFIIFDLTDPLAPARIGSYPVVSGRGMTVSGNRAYLLASNALLILDITSPATPILLGSYAIYGDMIRVQWDRAFVAQRYNLSFDVLDISDPGHVTLLGTVNAYFGVYGLVAASRDDLYTLGQFEGSSIIDHWNVSDPAHPSFEYENFLSHPADGMATDGVRLLVSGPYASVVDPNTLNPVTEIGVHPFGGTIAFGASFAYTWNGSAAHVFELGPPFRYRGTAFSASSTQAGGVADLGGWLYMADGAGLQVFAPPCGPVDMRWDGASANASASASPDPFSGRTDLRFSLAAPSRVTLSVYDPAGRRLRTLLGGDLLPAGTHVRAWDGRDEAGRELPAGVYFTRLGVNGHPFTGRVVRVR